MEISKVTITGADDRTDIGKLIELSRKYQFAEWGILFSKSKEGQQRYPSKEWIDELLKNDIKLSAHFCGWFSKEVLENKNLDLIKALFSSNFKRVQLNYNFKNSHGWSLAHILDFANSYEIEIILQHNRSNKKYLDNFLSQKPPSNINFLYDASGGRGTEIVNIPPPIIDHYTGYAGGIGLENIQEVCHKIQNLGDESKVWIDLESGARTNNEFDLDKVEEILRISKFFIN